MNGKNIIFDDKKINKRSFYKIKNLFNINDIDVIKILTSKKEPFGKKIHLNTKLDVMMTISLDHYV